MLSGDFKNITLLLTNNLVRLTHFVCNGISRGETEFHNIRSACINVFETEEACGDIPGFLLLKMEVHAELCASVKMENLPAVEIIIDEDHLMPPALLNNGWNRLLLACRSHMVWMESLVVDEEVIGRLSHTQLVMLTTPCGELPLSELRLIYA